MAKQEKKKPEFRKVQDDFELPDAINNDEFEVVSTSSFPPIWKPTEKDEFVTFIPMNVKTIEVNNGKKGKKENSLLYALLVTTNSKEFYSGKDDDATEVEKGDTVSIPLSYNLIGEDKLAYGENDTQLPTELSKLSLASASLKKPIMVIFKGKIPIGGGQTVKQFHILAAKGLKEASRN